MTESNSNYNNDSIFSDNLEKKDQRSLIFHLLYAVDSHNYDVSLEKIVESFSNNFGIIIKLDSDVFKKAEQIIKDKDIIDQQLLPLISTSWRPERLGTITRLILRIGAWELLNFDIDSAIIINESVELAKCFAERDAYKFVNGLLDEFAKQLVKNNKDQ